MFLDRTPVNIGLFSIKDVSLSVLVTVVSSNKYHFIVDAGSKVLSSDAYVALWKLVLNLFSYTDIHYLLWALYSLYQATRCWWRRIRSLRIRPRVLRKGL